MHTLVNVVIPPLAQRFTYELPPDLVETVGVGYEVEVSFGRRKASGFVVSKEVAADRASLPFEIKPISPSKITRRSFSASQLQFFQWIADYYCDSLANVIQVAVPPPAPPKYQRTVRILSPQAIPRGPLAKRILAFLNQHPSPADYSLLLRTFRGAGAAMKRMITEGILAIDERELCEHYRSQTPAPAWAKSEVILNAWQAHALERIQEALDARAFKVIVLHGVTGSGKTEVYIEAIRRALSQNRAALTIVPEIALTPQLLDRFRARIPEELAVLHSAINPRARWDAWRALLDQRLRLAVGARSAVFAPLDNLGIIVVDEEHDASYKQNEGLRYNARDAAIMRAKFEGCPIILGSATPSLESYFKSLQKKYLYLSLPSRPGSIQKPSLSLVDLNRTKPWEMPSKNVSPVLHTALGETIGRGEQTFILYNRRGFANYLQCSECEATVECPNCSVTLTLHQSIKALLCHYCGLSITPSSHCHACGKSSVEERGAGTEKVFDEIQSLFPSARIARLDRDAALDMPSYRSILDRVRDGQTDILVGTQMIAKGHDLPGVTLVGIVDSDIGLHMPDFRAAERTFHLLLQAAGRSGRGDKPGRVIIQTRVPRHPSITATLSHDFTSFAERELRTREIMGFPPFSQLVRIVVSSSDKDIALGRIRDITTCINQHVSTERLPVVISGPAPAPLRRLKTLWRFHLILKSPSRVALNGTVRAVQGMRSGGKEVRVIFDIDPLDML